MARILIVEDEARIASFIAKGLAADGYTIGVIANPFMFTDVLLRDASFDVSEFDPIVTISFDPVVWLVGISAPIGEILTRSTPLAWRFVVR